MKPHPKKIFLFALLTAKSSLSFADTPISIEDLFTDKGKIKIDVSATYANSNNQNVFTAEPINIQTGSTSFVSIPTLIVENQVNTDTIVGTIGLKYGLNKKSEIYGRASFLNNSIRSGNTLQSETSSENRFADAWIGVNYQIKPDDKTPAILGFAEVALREKHRVSHASLKSGMIGLTTYRALDPIVLSLTASYRFNSSRKDDGLTYKPGNFLLIAPSVVFAANDQISLSTGLQWINQYAAIYNEKLQGFRKTETGLVLGLGYGMVKGSSLNFTFKTNISGRSGADLRINWLHTF